MTVATVVTLRFDSQDFASNVLHLRAGRGFSARREQPVPRYEGAILLLLVAFVAFRGQSFRAKAWPNPVVPAVKAVKLGSGPGFPS